MHPLTREEHGREREGRITSSVAGLLMTGTQSSWERLAKHLDDPQPFYSPYSMPATAEGADQEPKIARRFFTRHPEIEKVENPVVIKHHNPDYPYRALIASSPDRVVDGLPLECKWVVKRSRWDKLRRPMLAGFLPPEFRAQVEWHIWMMGVSAGWLALATKDRYEDVLYEAPNLSHIDELLTRFMEQYQSYNIRGVKP